MLDSLEARICTYECSFCAACVDTILGNDNYLGKDPASTRVRHWSVDPEAHARFAAAIRNIPPEKR